MTETAPWLSEEEQSLWRRLLRLNALLPGVLHRDLQQDSGLSLPDFDVLVQLTDREDGRARIGDLARGLTWERSRVSHHVARMQRRGLVEREECLDDARGAFVVLTDKGREAIDGAAPGHVRTVRAIVFDDLSPDEAEVLGRFLDRLLARLSSEPASPAVGRR